MPIVLPNRLPMHGVPAAGPFRPATRTEPAPLRVRITALGVLSFLCGSFAFWKINLVGEIYLGELGLIALGFFAAAAGGVRDTVRNRVFWWLLVASVLTLLGYMLSDYVRGTPEALYMRGWARAILITTNFAALALLFAADRRNLWWFIAGMAIGGIAYFRFVEGLPLRSMAAWKFMYSLPVTMLLAATAALLPLRVVAIGFALLGVYSMFQDYRIHGAVCLLVAGLLWASATLNAMRVGAGTIVKVGLLGAIAFGGSLYVLSLTQNEWTEARRGSSNITRVIGVEFGLTAIARSPIIGYGSWASGPELIAIADAEIREHEESTGQRLHGGYGRAFHSHSQILQGWLEGGVLGAAVFLVLGFFLLRESLHAALQRPGDLLTPAILFLLIFQFWHLIASPLGSGVRLHFALAMAIVAMLYAERMARERRAAGPARQRAGP
jgi:hypothetical protein